MKLTIAICTYKRYDLLNDLLRKFESLEINFNETEILIIDNTPLELREKINSSFIRIINSEPPGLSRARNVAIKNSKADYIAFLDDDAVPSANWHKTIIDIISNTEYKYALLCGPIRPIWPDNEEPEWVPQKYKDCLTILDYGNNLLELDEWQFAYGANIIFQTSVIKEVGGFSLELGRVGNSTLLSDEEINVQKKIQALGYKRLYHPNVEVYHLVHKERLRRNYFIGRMSWQVVSDFIQQINLNRYDANKYIGELLRTNPKLLLPVLNLISNYEETSLESKIDVITALMRVLLSISLLEDHEINGKSQNHVSLFNRAVLLDYYDEIDSDETDILFIETQQNHSFLYQEYSKIEKSAFLKIEKNIWSEDVNYDEIKNKIKSGIKQIHFITIDPFVYGWGMLFISLLKKNGFKITGMLHRVIEDNSNLEKLSLVAALIDKLYSPSFEDSTKYKFLEYMPLPCTINDYILNEEHKNIHGKDPFVISMIGEVREGKSFDKIIELMKCIKIRFGNKIIFHYIGKAEEDKISKLNFLIFKEEINLINDLVSSSATNQYVVRPTSELVMVYKKSNLGIMLYDGIQKKCASGNLANYARLEIPVLVYKDSNVGIEVEKFGIGIAVENNTDEMITAIEDIMYSRCKFNFTEYNKVHSIESIKNQMIKYYV